MPEHDPFDLPNVRVMNRPRAASREERLAQAWIEAWQAKRDAEAAMARLRREIEPLLDAGLMLESKLGQVAWCESQTLRVEPVAMARDVGLSVFAKASTVFPGRIKVLIQGGLIAPDAPYVSYETVRRLVTTLR